MGTIRSEQQCWTYGSTQDEMGVQLPMVVGKKEEAKAEMMVELEKKEVGAKKFSWEQRGDAEVKMEEGVLTSNEVRQVVEGQLVGQMGGLGISGETVEILSLLSSSTMCRHF